MRKAPEAFRTISETAEALETPAHVLRFWESKFTQVKPVKRAGGRRYYRRADIDLLAGIKELLHEQGMTIRGVQKLLHEKGVRHVAGLAPVLDKTLNEDLADAAQGQSAPAPFSVVEGRSSPDDTQPDAENVTVPVAAMFQHKPPEETPGTAPDKPAPPAAAVPDSPAPALPAAAVPDSPAPAVPRDSAPSGPQSPPAPAPVSAPVSEPDTGDAPALPARTAIRLAHDIRRNMHPPASPDTARMAPLLARLEALLARMTAQAEHDKPAR